MLPKLVPAIFAALFASTYLPSAMAVPPVQWTWEAGTQTNNGAITIKSVTGGSNYSGTQNPTGAVAKTNQNAVTQPPTIILQATGAGFTFDYSHCYIFSLSAGYPARMIGYGILDSSSRFTGVFAYFGNLSENSTIFQFFRPPSLAISQAMTLFPAMYTTDPYTIWYYITGAYNTPAGFAPPRSISSLPTYNPEQCHQ